MRRGPFICHNCEEDTGEDEAPSYCPHCGWDGFGFAFDKEPLPEEVTA